MARWQGEAHWSQWAPASWSGSRGGHGGQAWWASDADAAWSGSQWAAGADAGWSQDAGDWSAPEAAPAAEEKPAEEGPSRSRGKEKAKDKFRREHANPDKNQHCGHYYSHELHNYIMGDAWSEDIRDAYVDHKDNFRMVSPLTNQSFHRRIDNDFMKTLDDLKTGCSSEDGGFLDKSIARQEYQNRFDMTVKALKASGGVREPKILAAYKSIADAYDFDKRVFNGVKPHEAKSQPEAQPCAEKDGAKTVKQVDPFASSVTHYGYDASSRELHQGKRGGVYYETAAGNKVYQQKGEHSWKQQEQLEQRQREMQQRHEDTRRREAEAETARRDQEQRKAEAEEERRAREEERERERQRAREREEEDSRQRAREAEAARARAREEEMEREKRAREAEATRARASEDSSHYGFHQSSGSANDRELFEGPRGGVYYVTAAGNKVYQK